MSLISTESTAPDNTSGAAGTTGTLKDLKTSFANLLINRVTLGECLNVIRDACVQRASDLVDEADAPTLENIKKDVEMFKTSGQETTNEAAAEVSTSGPAIPKSFETLPSLPDPEPTGPESTGPESTGPESTGPEPSASA